MFVIVINSFISLRINSRM